jgi:hypothetical protein
MYLLAAAAALKTQTHNHMNCSKQVLFSQPPLTLSTGIPVPYCIIPIAVPVPIPIPVPFYLLIISNSYFDYIYFLQPLLLTNVPSTAAVGEPITWVVTLSFVVTAEQNVNMICRVTFI